MCLLAACASSGGTSDAPPRRSVVAPDTDRQADEAPIAIEADEAAAASPQAAVAAVDLNIEPNLEEISDRIQRSFDSAVSAMRAGDWVQAELELEELLLEEPGFPGPYVNLALIYRRDGRDAEARAALEQAVAIAPGFAPANNALGVLLRERGEFAAAEAAYRRTLDTDPANAIALLNLGILLDLYLQRSDEALQHYTRYQATLSAPDETVARWIVDLERRISAAERVARD